MPSVPQWKRSAYPKFGGYNKILQVARVTTTETSASFISLMVAVLIAGLGAVLALFTLRDFWTKLGSVDNSLNIFALSENVGALPSSASRR
jgi:hypothetical protein